MPDAIQSIDELSIDRSAHARRPCLDYTIRWTGLLLDWNTGLTFSMIIRELGGCLRPRKQALYVKLSCLIQSEEPDDRGTNRAADCGYLKIFPAVEIALVRSSMLLRPLGHSPSEPTWSKRYSAVPRVVRPWISMHEAVLRAPASPTSNKLTKQRYSYKYLLF